MSWKSVQGAKDFLLRLGEGVQNLILKQARVHKGLYINYVILFWAILDTPLPPVIMSSFDIPPHPP